MVTKFEETGSLNVRSGRGKKPVSAEAIEKVALQELLPHDFKTRHLFSLQFLARLEVDPEWPWNILWTDEAHFHLDGAGGPVTCSITGEQYASLLRNKIIPDLQARQCLHIVFYARWSSSTHYTLCYGRSQTSLHRRTCDQPPISSSVASPIT
ncbi:uncharacterized protein TNCV_2125801 [Trichonephila clavipes]|nr:uncharacterized protein TNCV_2125801 [Trichonephila clavipes]